MSDPAVAQHFPWRNGFGRGRNLLSNIWRTPLDPERGSSRSSTSKRRTVDPVLIVAVVALALAFTALGVLLLLTGGDALRIG